MIALNTARQRKLVASLRLLESDKDGERQAALHAALRLLPPGVTLADVVEHSLTASPAPAVSTNPEPVDPRASWAFRGWGPTWRRKASACFARAADLSEKEAAFVENIAFARHEPSEKQRKWLDDIAAKLGVGQ